MSNNLPSVPENQDPSSILALFSKLPFLDRIVRIMESGVPATALLGTGIMTNDVAAVSAGLTATGMFGLKEGMEELKKRKDKSPDWGKVDLEAVFKIAGKAGARGDILRNAFRELLVKALDKDEAHNIRLEDQALVDSLNPSDFVMLFVLHNFAKEMNAETNTARENLRSKLNDMFGRTGPSGPASSVMERVGGTTALVRQFWNTAIGSELAIPDDELSYALVERQKDLFRLAAYSIDGNLYTAEGQPLLSSRGMAADGFFSATLTPKAARIAKLIAEYNPSIR